MYRKHGQLRLTVGVEEIEEWAEEADVRDRDAVYECLFTVADSTLLRVYPVLSAEQDGALSVLIRHDLAVSLVFPEPGTFGVLAIADPTVPDREDDRARHDVSGWSS